MIRGILAAALCAARFACIPVAALLALCLVAPAIAETGRASWYGPGFHGRLTASGERFDQHAATCAHRTMRFGVKVRVLNLRTGKAAICRINDRGPFVAGRVIDVSRGVAARLGMLGAGVAPVRITPIN
jgi:rare lipoprotein A